MTGGLPLPSATTCSQEYDELPEVSCMVDNLDKCVDVAVKEVFNEFFTIKMKKQNHVAKVVRILLRVSTECLKIVLE